MAYRVLVIAAEIRTLQHIEYTPAPDIIHESAGHAPIIADSAYREYLSYFGSIGAKAIFSKQDSLLYEAIRALSILKEMPETDEIEIKKAEDLVNLRQENMGDPSEMALLSRLHWWTVEYGMIGTLDNPKIYGAGLLSSIGESSSCMRADIKKIPYTIDAINYPYDITQAQPQLFVTSSFQNLVDVLEKFADTMAFRIGGVYGIKKAINSKQVCTAVLSSGLQVSGTFTTYKSYREEVCYVQTKGPTMLAYRNNELPGQGKTSHPFGFGSPLGKLLETETPLECLEIEFGKSKALHFESGIKVTGLVTNLTKVNGENLIISFSECTVIDSNGEILFHPSWGNYELAVGEKIISVFCGAADKAAFVEPIQPITTISPHASYDDKTLKLHELYQQVRNIRNGSDDQNCLKTIWEKLKGEHPGDWLCPLEILEQLENKEGELAVEISDFLNQKSANEPRFKKLIGNGLNLITSAFKKREMQ
jgi:phenylalanine-4-hydroxylase